MKEVIAIVSRKGGSGKTTTAQALGGILKAKGYKVLLIDLDAQRNLSQAMGADLTRPNITNFFDGSEADEVAQCTDNGFIIAGSKYLDAADIILKSNKELQRALDRSDIDCDYVIIDTPASPGRLTLNALAAATSAIITLEAAPFSYDGIDELTDTIEQIKEVNKALVIRGIVITKYDGRSNAARKNLDDFRAKAKQIGTKVIEPPIRATAKVFEAQGRRQNLNEYAPKSTAAQDYAAIVEHIIKW